MIVIEMAEDKFGDVMKNISCIEDKLSSIKEVFELESFGLRKNYRDDEYYRDDYRTRTRSNRYI